MAEKLQQGFDPMAVVDDSEDCNSFLVAIRSHAQLQLNLDPETDEEELDRAVHGHCYHGVLTCLTIENCDIWVSRPLSDAVLQVIGVFDVTRKVLFL